jgi:diaminohydroxyphosphoribosylaminopyrimidine deaminase/5-amino-6-(5-phosphoribosylamino)uracil reductase
VDRIVWFHAPGLLGGDALPALQSLGIDRLSSMARFKPAPAGPCLIGADMMSAFSRA